MKRYIFLFLALFLCLFSLTVNVSAASGNLIHADLSEWSVDDGDLNGSVVVTNSSSNVYRVKIIDDGSSSQFNMIYVFDSASIVAGHSYSFSCDIPVSNNPLYYDCYAVGFYLGYRQLNGEFINSQEIAYIDSSNASSVVGNTINITFQSGSSAGSPCLLITFYRVGSNSGTVHYYDFGNVSLIDNDDNSGELKGIKGFLHSIRWEIVGGVCDDSDCPHSVLTNPHTSLSAKINSAFTTMFEDLFFRITDLGSDIGGFFSDLGSDIGGFFTDLGIDIGGFFSDLWSDISAFFEKFKPRVYEQLNWVTHKYVHSTTGLVMDSVATIHSTVTDFFSVPAGSKYIAHYDRVGQMALVIYVYSADGEYQSYFVASSGTDYVLNSDSSYRFCLYDTTKDFSSFTDLSSFSNSHCLIYCDEGWLGSVVNSIAVQFERLGNLIMYFDVNGDYVNPFVSDDSLISRVGSYLTTFSDFVSDSVDDLTDTIDSATGAIHIFKIFVERFPWVFGLVTFAFIMIVFSKVIGL